jgi:hypothetical protein
MNAIILLPSRDFDSRLFDAFSIEIFRAQRYFSLSGIFQKNPEK